MKIISLLIIMLPLYLVSDDIKEINCDDDLILIIDEENMTEDEILKAKEDHFIALLSQQNDECISVSMATQSLNTSTTNKGGQISGTDISQIKVKSSTGSSLSSEKTNENEKQQNTSNQLTQNGAVIKCLEKYKDDDEFSKQLKESISKTKDPIVKKELIDRYAKYNNIKREEIKC